MPNGNDRMAIAAAAATWCGALAGFHAVLWVPAVVAGVLLLGRRGPALLLALLVAVGGLSGTLAAERRDAVLTADVPEGPARLLVEVVDDQRHGDPALLIVRPLAVADGAVWEEWLGPPLAMAVDGAPVPAVGSRLVVEGTVAARPRLVRGDPVAGSLSIARMGTILPPGSPLLRAGNAVRERVRGTLGSDESRALLAGFLIGDTADVPAADLEALRRSGLTHFVAVSGSNVALFLLGVWLVSGFVGLGTRGRAVVGVVAVAVFAVATRWEPSVLRASVMAVLMFGGAAVGLPVPPWVALGAAATMLLAVSGQLAADVGFQLSVVATAGVLFGSHLFAGRRPRWMWAPLGATIGAQVGVTPLLLIHFGTVPLLSPLANVIAAPLVTTATATGAVAVVVGSGPLAALAALAASGVLAVARLAAAWPQLSLLGVIAAMLTVTAAIRLPRARPVLALAVVVAVGSPAVMAHRAPAVVTATFIDVGQGDATLIEDPSGAVVLVDGGRDPTVLQGALRGRHIHRIDLLVATHGDADHVAGLAGLADVIGIGAIWIPDHPDLGPELDELVGEAVADGIPIVVPAPGDTADLGDAQVVVLGPRRRYLAQNDGSIVLWVTSRLTLLLAGDIEAVAQRELPPLQPDVLLVPHHGSATSDLDWLRHTVGELAVVSVGENTYGHPSPAVMVVLAESGAEVHITRDEGDVVVSLG